MELYFPAEPARRSDPARAAAVWILAGFIGLVLCGAVLGSGGAGDPQRDGIRLTAKKACIL